MNALVDIDRLSVAYDTQEGQVQALTDISLSIGRGEVIGLVGESGSGKSTLVSALLALLPGNAHSSGRLMLDGRDLLSLPPRELQSLRGGGIAAVFQDPFTSLNPVVSIGDHLIEFQHHDHDRSRKAKRTRAVEMLARVGISEPERRLRQYPFELSGGMRQRVAIAAALLTRPRLLIADEPTTALDATTEAQIVDLLKQVRGEVDGAIVFVTHHLRLVAQLCDRVAVMYAGRVVELGTTAELFAAPLHPYTRALLDCDPAYIAGARRRLPTIAGSVPSLLDLPPGCSFAPRCCRATAVCHEHSPPPVPRRDGGWALCFRPLQ
jgi:peptide/nickel transport system ATP-binding protein